MRSPPRSGRAWPSRWRVPFRGTSRAWSRASLPFVSSPVPSSSVAWGRGLLRRVGRPEGRVGQSSVGRAGRARRFWIELAAGLCITRASLRGCRWEGAWRGWQEVRALPSVTVRRPLPTARSSCGRQTGLCMHEDATAGHSAAPSPLRCAERGGCEASHDKGRAGRKAFRPALPRAIAMSCGRGRAAPSASRPCPRGASCPAARLPRLGGGTS